MSYCSSNYLNKDVFPFWGFEHLTVRVYESTWHTFTFVHGCQRSSGLSDKKGTRTKLLVVCHEICKLPYLWTLLALLRWSLFDTSYVWSLACLYHWCSIVRWLTRFFGRCQPFGDHQVTTTIKTAIFLHNLVLVVVFESNDFWLHHLW